MAVDADSVQTRIELPCMLTSGWSDEAGCVASASTTWPLTFVLLMVLTTAVYTLSLCGSIAIGIGCDARDRRHCFDAWGVSATLMWIAALYSMHMVGLALPGMVGGCVLFLLATCRVSLAVCGGTSKCCTRGARHQDTGGLFACCCRKGWCGREQFDTSMHPIPPLNGGDATTWTHAGRLGEDSVRSGTFTEGDEGGDHDGDNGADG